MAYGSHLSTRGRSHGSLKLHRRGSVSMPKALEIRWRNRTKCGCVFFLRVPLFDDFKRNRKETTHWFVPSFCCLGFPESIAKGSHSRLARQNMCESTCRARCKTGHAEQDARQHVHTKMHRRTCKASGKSSKLHEPWANLHEKVRTRHADPKMKLVA